MFIKLRPVELMIYLYERDDYLSSISKETGIIFCHVKKLMVILKKHGLVENKDQRKGKRIIGLTERGRLLAEEFVVLVGLIRDERRK